MPRNSIRAVRRPNTPSKRSAPMTKSDRKEAKTTARRYVKAVSQGRKETASKRKKSSRVRTRAAAAAVVLGPATTAAEMLRRRRRRK